MPIDPTRHPAHPAGLQGTFLGPSDDHFAILQPGSPTLHVYSTSDARVGQPTAIYAIHLSQWTTTQITLLPSPPIASATFPLPSSEGPAFGASFYAESEALRIASLPYIESGIGNDNSQYSLGELEVGDGLAA